jgi:hypothetical protein
MAGMVLFIFSCLLTTYSTYTSLSCCCRGSIYLVICIVGNKLLACIIVTEAVGSFQAAG